MQVDLQSKSSGRARRILAAAAWAIGTSLIVGYVAAFGVNVPINDDWDQVTVSLRWSERGLTAESVLSPHNEHCLAVPRLISHAILVASGGNYRALLFVNALIAASALAVALAFASRWRVPLSTCAVLGFGVAALMSGWCQWQNWLWAFQTPWFLLPFLLVVAAAVVARVRSVSVAVTATVVATMTGPLCMANGTLIGWALLPGLALRLVDEPRGIRGRALTIAALACIAATSFGVWGIMRSSSPSAGDLSSLMTSPLQGMELLLAVLGSPLDPRGSFAGQKSLATIAGGCSLLLGCVAAVGALRRFRTVSLRDLGPGFALMTYGIASVAAVIGGRSGMLMAGPVESRYSTFAVAWQLGVLMTFGWLMANGTGKRLRIWCALTMVASAIGIGATASGIGLFLAHGNNMRRALEAHQAIYRSALEPGGRERLEAISSHYGAQGILERISGMRRAGILHPDYAPSGLNHDAE